MTPIGEVICFRLRPPLVACTLFSCWCGVSKSRRGRGVQDAQGNPRAPCHSEGVHQSGTLHGFLSYWFGGQRCNGESIITGRKMRPSNNWAGLLMWLKWLRSQQNPLFLLFFWWSYKSTTCYMTIQYFTS